jgi:hypothetical protein
LHIKYFAYKFVYKYYYQSILNFVLPVSHLYLYNHLLKLHKMVRQLLKSLIMLVSALVILISCNPKDDDTDPDNGLETGDIFEVSATSAKININLDIAGNITIDEKGICWSKSGTPTVEDQTHDAGSGTGSYTGLLTNLTPTTRYRVRPYYITEKGKIEYGKETSFTTENSPFIGEWQNQSGTVVYTGTKDGLTFKSITSSSSGLNWAQAHQRGYVKLGDQYLKNIREQGNNYTCDALWYWGTASEGVKGVGWSTRTTLSFKSSGTQIYIESYSPFDNSFSAGTLYKK